MGWFDFTLPKVYDEAYYQTYKEEMLSRANWLFQKELAVRMEFVPPNGRWIGLSVTGRGLIKIVTGMDKAETERVICHELAHQFCDVLYPGAAAHGVEFLAIFAMIYKRD